jgi:hypothetical protein
MLWTSVLEAQNFSSFSTQSVLPADVSIRSRNSGSAVDHVGCPRHTRAGSGSQTNEHGMKYQHLGRFRRWNPFGVLSEQLCCGIALYFASRMVYAEVE